MQIHRIRGRDLKDALHRARRAHGDGAVVLSQESARDGSVTLAVAEKVRVPPSFAGGTPGAAQRAAQPATPPPAPSIEPGLAEVRRRLESTGCSSDLTGRVLRRVKASGKTGAYAIDEAALAIGELFQVAESPRVGSGTHVLAFAGPPAAGKTSTVTKLAIRLVRAKRRVRIVAMIAEEDARAERRYPDLLRPLVDVARSGAELAAIVSRSRQAHALLIDTTGVPFRDVPSLREFREKIAGSQDAPEIDNYIVASAAGNTGKLQAFLRNYRMLKPSAGVVTHLDSAQRPMACVEKLSAASIPLLFLCNGPDLARHFRRAAGELLADLALRGKLT